MDKIKEYREKIIDTLKYIERSVKFDNKAGRFNINKDAEEFYRGLLNLIYGWNLIGLNTDKDPNYRGADLGDIHSHIAVQITSENDSEKVHKSIKGFKDKCLPEGYQELYILMFRGKGEFPKADFKTTVAGAFEFDKSKHIIDHSDLCSKIGNMEFDKLKGIYDYLEERIGFEKNSRGKKLEFFWETWSNATNPPLNSKLLLAGRQEFADKIYEWLRNSPSHLTVKSERERLEEIIAIFFATLDQLSTQEGESWINRCVIVEDTQNWNTLAHSTQPLILIPTFSDRSQVLSAVNLGHHVLIPTSWTEHTSKEKTVSIPFLQGDLAEAVLIEMGLPQHEAPKLAILARRGLILLRRKLAIEPALLKPAWSEPGVARQCLSAVLVGGWDDKHSADQDILCHLDGRSYSEIREHLIFWSKQPDTFIRLEDEHGFWTVVSKEDAWWHLSSYVLTAELEKFEEVVLDVFKEIDPQFELPIEQRLYANILGKTSKISGWLKRGLAETLVIMAIVPSFSFSGSQWAGRIVRKLFSEVKEWQHWASLSPYFQLFAEAAPKEFLEAVERGLSGENPILVNLFTDLKSNMSMGNSLHTELLWALEILAWSPEHLTDSPRLLAKLAKLDPGGTLVNRPINSLGTIFLLWYPYAFVDLPEKLKVIDLIRKREPQIAWDLMVNLIPKPLDLRFPTAKPQWREWIKEEKQSISYDELFQGISAIVQRLLEDVGTVGSRWHSLIQLLDDVPKTDLDKITEKLQTIDAKIFSQNDCIEIWNGLRNFITKHLNFSETKWALPKEFIEPLKQILSRFEPENLVLKHGWLFTSCDPNLLGIKQTQDKYRKVLSNSRIQAVTEIYKQGGIELLFQLAKQTKAELCHLVGIAIAQSRLLDDQEERFLTQYLSSENKVHDAVAYAFLVECSHLKGQEWLNSLPSKPCWKTWTVQQKAEYYRRLSSYETLSEANCEAIRQLIQCGELTSPLLFRYLQIIDRQILNEHPLNPKLVVELTELLVEKIKQNHVEPSSYDSYGIIRILDFLESSSEIEVERMAQLEWFFMPLLRFQREPRILHKALTENPDFFVEVLTWAFIDEEEKDGKDNEKDLKEITDTQKIRAKLSYQLLEDWQQLPGLQDNDDIDAEKLGTWIKQARELAGDRHRSKSCDSQIGRVLSYSPLGSDSQYPHETIRELIENLESEELERGFFLGIVNQRGLISKSLNEGGEQEYALAEKYRNYAVTIKYEYPRTAKILDKIASFYERSAKKADNEVRLREDGIS